MFEMSPQKLSFKDKAESLATEFDSRAPRLRMSVFAYAIEHPHKFIKNVDDFVALCEEITEFIGEYTSEFSDFIGTFHQEEKLMEDEEIDGDPRRDGPYL